MVLKKDEITIAQAIFFSKTLIVGDPPYLGGKTS